jgi:hypothetical protein
MPRTKQDDITDRFTIFIPAPEDRRTIAHIINKYGTSKTGAVRIALREYARANALPVPVDEYMADQS